MRSLYSFLLGITATGLTAAPLPNWAASAGATTPFITREAEDPKNTTNGNVVRLNLPPSNVPTPAHEASGRAFVELSATGAHLDIPVTAAANALVVRFCIPDADAGGGLDATLSLYVNGAFRQKLSLSSRHSWLYGKPGQNGQSNTPGDGAHVFWDEARCFINGGIQPGDTLTLRKDVADTASYYRIDLVDLEQVAPPLESPAAGTFLSAADFGATGDDDTDDTKAIAACIAAAKQQGKIAWIPAGAYRQSNRFQIEGPVIVKGAGPWHTSILGTVAGTDWVGNNGFNLSGDGPRVSDLRLESLAHTSRSHGAKAFTGKPVNWAVENVWITHTNVGFWMSGATRGVIRDCRVRLTYADAINLNRGASHNLIVNNHVRGCGDDGIAILSETERNDPPSQGNIVRNNTVHAIWWGHNLDLAGGGNHVIEGNHLADNAYMGVLTINLPSAYPNHPLSDSVIRRNVLVRGGGDYAFQKRGAFWIFAGSTTITNVLADENLILNPMFSAIHLVGAHAQKMTFKGNIIDSPGTDGISIDAKVRGHGVFTGNTVHDLSSGHLSLRNHAGANYKTTLSGNSL